jgi:isopenicillin-N N-acyltransferase-like protein
MAVPLIEISGDARTRGRQHGEAARDRIRRSIAYYREAFTRTAKLRWDQVVELSPRWVPIVEAYHPGIAEEVRGIAEGAAVTFEEILALNGRGELSSGDPFQGSGDPFRDGEYEDCSSFAVLPPASGDGHVWCGQNWDWRTETGETVIVLRIVQPGRPTIVMQTEAGQVGRHGVNSAGIALNANGLGVRFGTGLGVPQPFIRRRILDSFDMQSALTAVFDSTQSICTNLLITHRDGFAIDIETTPARHGWMYPTDGLLVHTNHFVAFVPEQIAATYRPFSVNSLWRLDRLTQGLRKVRVARTPEGTRAAIRTALQDHFGHPDSLCKHPNPLSAGTDRNETITSSIVDLTAGEYRLAAGHPCESPHELLPWNVYEHERAEAPDLLRA